MTDFIEYQPPTPELAPRVVKWEYLSDPDPAKSVNLAEKAFIEQLIVLYPFLSGHFELKDDAYEFKSEEALKIAVGFREEFINELYHGNLESSGPDLIERAKINIKNNPKLQERIVAVTLSAKEKEFSVTLSDQGKGFDVADVKDSTAPENLMSGTGRGQLITFYQRNIQRTKHGMIITLTKNLGDFNRAN